MSDMNNEGAEASLREQLEEYLTTSNWMKLANAEDLLDRYSQGIAREAEERGIKKATGGYFYNMPIKSVRSRNTAFKLYAVKFFNGEIKKRRERLLAELTQQQSKEAK